MAGTPQSSNTTSEDHHERLRPGQRFCPPADGRQEGPRREGTMKALIELHSELVAFHGYPVQVEVAIAAWHPRKEQIMLNRRSDTSLALYRLPDAGPAHQPWLNGLPRPAATPNQRRAVAHPRNLHAPFRRSPDDSARPRARPVCPGPQLRAPDAGGALAPPGQPGRPL